MLPSCIEEARSYLGAVNFYRRFIPRIGLMATPITNMLKTSGVYDQEAVEVAVKAAASEETMDDAMETEIVSVALVSEVWATSSKASQPFLSNEVFAWEMGS